MVTEVKVLAASGAAATCARVNIARRQIDLAMSTAATTLLIHVPTCSGAATCPRAASALMHLVASAIMGRHSTWCDLEVRSTSAWKEVP